MKPITIFLFLCLSAPLSAQFSYKNPGKYTQTVESVAKPTSSGTKGFVNANADDEAFQENIDRLAEYVSKKENKVNKIEMRLEKKQAVTERDSALYLLSQNLGNVKSINYVRESKPGKNKITTQALGGMDMTKNLTSEHNGGVVELGGKVSNSWLRLPSRYKFEVEEEDGQYVVTNYKQIRTLNFDVITRGLLPLSDLKYTTSEYVNSSLGSAFTLRNSFQNELWNNKPIYDAEEPKFFFNFNTDARLIPIFDSTQIHGLGVSLQGMPSFVAVFPSGNSDTDKADNSIIFQLSGNAALLSNNVRDALAVDEGDNPLNGNVAFCLEARIGQFSDSNPNKNWSVFAKYTWQQILGPNLTFGFAFAPQGQN